MSYVVEFGGAGLTGPASLFEAPSRAMNGVDCASESDELGFGPVAIVAFWGTGEELAEVCGDRYRRGSLTVVGGRAEDTVVAV
jgi:hypothetical protein